MSPHIRSMSAAVTAAVDQLAVRESAARKQRPWHWAALTIWVIGAVGSTAATARAIDHGEPWWLLTIGALITAAWAITARAEWDRLERVNLYIDACQEARQGLADEDFTLFLDIMSSPDHYDPDTAPEGTTP